ncbi:hypothetical protein E1B28_003633 [Marasmius oreades]|uniref:DUF6534 domain-containing protein n=1 Tax=Marasmius oreades TaxID=181124 RepID=A0A9P7UX24_9AGAR|nr:uncharacterized protein E1B28_003633 [Marasmius oreades]KAG7096183.1 hypothetical protein E1B28_003633 [Marasmius oreades]
MAPPLRLVFGPMLIGVFFNVMLWGIMAVQTMAYFQRYKMDALILRFFVSYLIIAETVNSILGMAMVYNLLVTEWGSKNATIYFPELLLADPLLTVLISTPIQIFVAYRIQIISQVIWIPIIVVLLALVSMGGGLWTSVMVRMVKLFARKPELHTPALTWLLASAIADVAITISLCWSLAQRKTGFKRTDDMINRVLRLTVQTGLITAVFALLDVICFLALPRSTINFIWDFALSKLYTNALLSTLNARAGWCSVAGVDTHNVLFGTSLAPASDGEIESRWRGSMYTTHPELSFPPFKTGGYEMDEVDTQSRTQRRHGDEPRSQQRLSFTTQSVEPPDGGVGGVSSVKEVKESRVVLDERERERERRFRTFTKSRTQTVKDTTVVLLPLPTFSPD